MFYKMFNEVEISSGPYVQSETYTLIDEFKNTYELPIDNWYWFDTKEEAYAFFGVDLPVDNTSV